MARWAVKDSDTLISAHQIEWIYLHAACALFLKIHCLLGADIWFQIKAFSKIVCFFFFFQPLPVTSSNNSHCSKHSLIHWIQGSTLDSSFRAIHYHDWSDFSRMTAKWKPQEEGRINFGVIPQISLHFRVIKASSYKPGNTNRAVAGTLQQCKLQALWLTQIYGGTPLPSNPQ